MGTISGLPDELLLKILSFLPTKVSVSTSLLSKRWEFLWMWLPKLEYGARYDSESALRDFINKKLPLHRAPVIESLLLEFGDSHIRPEDIKRWLEIAVSRYVSEVEVSYCSGQENIFLSSLSTCKSLVILKLKGMVLMDVPSMVCLPSLKTLQLKCLIYFDEGSLQQLLSICPVLEDLSVDFGEGEHFEEFTIVVQSLQSLSLFIPDWWPLDGYVIDTPSLKYFKLEDFNYLGHYSEIKNMPKLREAYVDVGFDRLKSVIGSITSVKRLTICSEVPKECWYDDGFVFNQLEHLKLCICKNDSSYLLGWLLKDSPNLQVLDISHMKDHGSDERNAMVFWNQPSPVPDCLLSSLQSFNWSRYLRRPQDRDIAVYIFGKRLSLKDGNNHG